MQRASRFDRLAILVASVLLALGGCAATRSGDDAPFSPTGDDASEAVSYTVLPGDSLANIALEFTGDRTNWEAIAAHNGIADPRRLRAGAEIEIPGRLMASAAASGEPASRPVSIAGTPAAQASATRREAVVTDERPALVERSAPVVVSAVQTNRRFELAPLQGGGDIDAGRRYVKVAGTYFPVAIYDDAAPAARLLMRVTPGTVLALERELGAWYRVETERGTGYLRVADGNLLSAREAARITVVSGE